MEPIPTTTHLSSPQSKNMARLNENLKQINTLNYLKSEKKWK